MSKPQIKPSNQIIQFTQLIEKLAGHELDPLKNSEITRLMGTNAVATTRLLQNGEAAGWVEKTPDGRWRLAAKRFTNVAVAVHSGIQKAKSRMDDEANNLTRSLY